MLLTILHVAPPVVPKECPWHVTHFNYLSESRQSREAGKNILIYIEIFGLSESGLC